MRADAPGKTTSIQWFVPIATNVPSDVWDVDLDSDSELGELRIAIFQTGARVLGQPLWLQDEAHWGRLVMQFDESFVGINLGDSGIIYVF